MGETFSRRELITRALPAAALVGTGLMAMQAYGQTAGSAPAAAGVSAGDAASSATQPGGAGAAAGKGSGVGVVMAQAFQNGQYLLPKLPYDANALEPHIDAQTMQLHHDKHHQAYVDGLNKTIKALAELRKASEIDPDRLSGLQQDLSFNGGGHILHSLFWATMTPAGGDAPQGALSEALNKDFGAPDTFRNYSSKVAMGVKGSGWALLAYEPLGDCLMVFEVNEHDMRMIAGAVPLLPLDVWEHAYYLKYQNKRADYVKAWWNVVNWAAVGQAYDWVRSRYRPQGGGK